MFLNNPEIAKVGDHKYKIDTDYRAALKCQQIAVDESIGEYERAIAILYTLYGDDVFKYPEDQAELLRITDKYLKCGIETQDNKSTEEPDMNIIDDFKLIQASFKSDYGMDIQKENIHWWDFMTYMNGLTDKCVLNRVREIRTYDTSKLEPKDRQKIKKMQQLYALKEQPVRLTEEQKRASENFYKITGIKRRGE